MSTAIIRIPRPTRIELLRLKKRLALARRFHSLLRDREVYLSRSLQRDFEVPCRGEKET